MKYLILTLIALGFFLVASESQAQERQFIVAEDLDCVPGFVHFGDKMGGGEVKKKEETEHSDKITNEHRFDNGNDAAQKMKDIKDGQHGRPDICALIRVRMRFEK